MSDIIITWPKKRTLESYLDELDKACEAGLTIHYRVASKPRVEAGDRCFMVHDGAIRGWNIILGVAHRDDVIDPISGTRMKPGWYIERDPLWHPMDNSLEMAGFRGYRYVTTFDLP